MQKLTLVLGLAALVGVTLYLGLKKNTVEGVPEEVLRMYSQWKDMNNKSFGLEDTYRLRVFLMNIMRNQEIAAQNPRASFTNTRFLDLTPEEFSAKYLGLKVGSRGNGNKWVSKGEAPEEVDWREEDIIRDVKDQGACGSCWAFSAVGALEAHRHHTEGKPAEYALFSEQQVVDCSWDQGNMGCSGGWMHWAFQHIQDHGITTQDEYPYEARDLECTTEGGEQQITSYTELPEGDCDALVEAIAQQPISVAVDASVWSGYDSGVLESCGTSLNHGVVAVGFTPEFYIVRNSWSAGWGEEGYIRLARGNTCGICSVNSFPTI